MNASNIFLHRAKDGMAKRAQVIMMGEDASELTKFFRAATRQRDENLFSLAIDYRSPYTHFHTVRGIGPSAEMTWMWCWSWESTHVWNLPETIPTAGKRRLEAAAR